MKNFDRAGVLDGHSHVFLGKGHEAERTQDLGSDRFVRRDDAGRNCGRQCVWFAGACRRRREGRTHFASGNRDDVKGHPYETALTQFTN
jgi:hypothetical protein